MPRLCPDCQTAPARPFDDLILTLDDHLDVHLIDTAISRPVLAFATPGAVAIPTPLGHEAVLFDHEILAPTTPLEIPSAAAIPEPASATLLLLGLAGLARRRRLSRPKTRAFLATRSRRGFSVYSLLAIFMATVCFGSLFTSPSQAQLLEYDDPSVSASADGLNLSYDPTTQFQWLDLTVTEGRSFDDIIGNDGTDELGPGGDFEGYRYATELEVHGWSAMGQFDSLYKTFDWGSGFASIGGYPSVRNFLSFLGCSPTSNCGSFGFIGGVCVDDETESTPRWGKVEALSSQGRNTGTIGGCRNPVPFTAHVTNDFSTSYGHFLVRVPEPGFAMMLAAGVGTLATLRPRRYAAGVSRGMVRR